MQYQPGDILFDKYRIDKQIGQGAFARVYRATHLGLKRPRAIKVLRQDATGLGSTLFSDYQLRFQLEAQLGDQLNHPNIIQVYDFEQQDQALLLVMEYALGGSLAERLKGAKGSGEPIPVDEVIRMGWRSPWDLRPSTRWMRCTAT